MSRPPVARCASQRDSLQLVGGQPHQPAAVGPRDAPQPVVQVAEGGHLVGAAPRDRLGRLPRPGSGPWAVNLRRHLRGGRKCAPSASAPRP